jgi:DNA polymerase
VNIICLDFETFFSDDYTLKKMTTEAYIRDRRFEAHGCAVKFAPGMPARWVDRDQLPALFAQIDWSRTAVVLHHAHFDGLILEHHCHVRPAFYFCTLSMGRLLLGNHLSVALGSLAAHFGLQPKSVPYELFKGRHWWELDQWTRHQVGTGACHDVELTWQIFHLLASAFPREEYAIVDATVRMFTQPVFEADRELLASIAASEEERKASLLAELDVTESDLQSAEKFASLLRAAGIEPETKPGKHGPIYAFAKTDPFMRDLEEDDDPHVQALVAARIGHKGTLLQSRAQRLLDMAGRGPLCVYLAYAAANTTRWGGGDKLNWQNFPRVDKSPLRTALLIPDGWVAARVDLSQIECRILNYLAGQHDVIERFRKGEDPYVGIASEFYSRPITRSDTEERGTGKQAELSCGFGCGPAKFKRTAALGIYGPPVALTDWDADRFVRLYRERHPAVVDYWRQGDRVLRLLAGGAEGRWGPMTIRDKRVYLPNGAPLIYDTLEWHIPEPDSDWGYGPGYRVRRRKGWQHMYGAKTVENVVQALARVVLSQAMRVFISYGLRILLATHDDLVILLKDDGAQQHAYDWIIRVLCTPPEWLPAIPLDAEGYMGRRMIK